MKKAVPFGHEKGAILGRWSYDKRSANSASALTEKPNRCMIVPSNVEMIAEAIERKDTDWFVRTNAPNDLIIQIDKKHSFHLHILPMVSRSAYLNRLIFEKRNNNNCSSFVMDGNSISYTNAVSHLYCAANFLEMVDDLQNGNLVSKTESFLSFIIFSSWKDTFIVLKTCETISSSAREFHVQRRYGFSMENDIDCPFPKRVSENWWFEDVGSLRIDHFIEVVACLRKKGLKSDVLGSCIAYWTVKWVSRVCIGIRVPTQKGVTVTVNQVRRVTVESLIRVLPTEENSVPCNFLFHLLKLGLTTKVETSLCSKLNLLVKNYGESEALFDVGIIARVVETYVSLASRNPLLNLFVVGRLVDGFLVLVARDTNLPPDDFRVLAESLPKNARYSNDTLYRAIDCFLKAHRNITEEERKGICRVVEYNKLSEEAREHAMKSERLPLNTTTQFILLEQVKMMKSVVESGSIYRRTKAQMIINVKADSRRECKQIETIKSELNRLHACRVQIKRLARKLW
ncbi:hypothetical protein RND81_09G130400 [Saponaria officinalis]|uniref:NPH3 domain-containing protein n=1 Tax=Saponaria officinalis TaxID=3572 RepID=A0AAW1IM58_SAPOF